MELKTIFQMTKTDRYTQDGRDELAKLQETEDVKYKTGDISQKTGLQKQPDGSWAPPKKGGKPTGKNGPSRMEKEEAIRKDLGLRGENDLERFSDEQIEMMYQKSQRTPEQQKADFNNSKIGQAVNKGRQEFAAEKARQKELASKTNAIGLPKESKPAEKSLAGTPMKKADLNSKDPYEITHSMKPDTASEAKEMDKISAFMQEETGATLRNAILARESFYKNTKNPTPEQQEGLAALMKIQQKLGYGKPAESKPTGMPKITEKANKYVMPDLDSMSDEDKVFKALNAELAESFGDRDGNPGNVGTWANRWLDYAMEEGGIGFKKSHNSTEPDAVVSGEDVMKIVEENPERWHRIISNAQEFYHGKGRSSDFESDEFYPIKLVGGKTVPSSEWYAKSKRRTGDSAPRELTGDCKIRIRK